MKERDENGLPKHSLLEISETLERLVWKICLPVSGANVKTGPLEAENLQELIQPPTLHITLIKDMHGEDGVVAKVIGDATNNFPWDTFRAAQVNSYVTNSYS